jgi:ribosomal protein S18 acetylase RimI-like enzyme
METQNWNFQPAQLIDFQPILKLYRSCGKKMSEQGFHNWVDFYPTEIQIIFDIENQHLYTLYNADNQLVAVAVLDQIAAISYQNIKWDFLSSQAFYLHRLAVSPLHWQAGIGQKMMLFIEKKAVELQADTIRLDAYSINKPLLKFYKNLNYVENGQIVWHGDAWQFPFLCFEKNLV